MPKAILSAERLILEYKPDFKLQVLKVQFEQGRIYALTGPNGSGKTTLLNILNLISLPATGRIIFKGRPVDESNSLAVRRKMSMIMQDAYLFSVPVLENITYGLKLRKAPKKKRQKLAVEALKMVGLSGFEKRYPSELSSGESQRVAIARALVLKPEVLFLDEPFANIDKKNIDMLEELIKRVSYKDKTAVIFTTHDIWQAYRLSDKVISLVSGKLVEGGLENFFSGNIVDANGLKQVKISPRISINIVGEKQGMAHLCIAPEDVIVSHEQIHSSARNCFSGIIKVLHLQDDLVRVSVMVDKGVILTALISKKSYKKMSLSIDQPVFMTFKSTCIKVL